MDTLSLAVGFLVGAATGAAGSYMADKFTDARRQKARIKAQQRLWKDIEARFPSVIAEMRDDFSSHEGRNVRSFFVKESTTMIGFLSEPCFEYHTDKHPDLRAAVHCLEQHGFISDITPGSCPKYRVHEHLIDWLVGPNKGFNRTPESTVATEPGNPSGGAG